MQETFCKNSVGFCHHIKIRVITFHCDNFDEQDTRPSVGRYSIEEHGPERNETKFQIILGIFNIIHVYESRMDGWKDVKSCIFAQVKA